MALRRLAAPALLLASATVAACGAEPVADPASGMVALERLPSLQLEQQWTLGGPEAPEPEAFRRVPDVTVGPGGELYLLDSSVGTVRAFGPDGIYRGDIGAPGEGPGELTTAISAGLTGDSIWIRNGSPPWVGFYDTAGEYLGRFELEDPVIARGGMPEGPTAMLQNGAWYAAGIVPIREAGSGRVQVPLTLTRGDGTVDTLGQVWDPPGFFAEGVGSMGNVWSDPLPPLHAATPDGSAVLLAAWDSAAPGVVEVRRFGAVGGEPTRDTVRFVPIPLSAVRDSITSAAVDSVRALATRTNELIGREVISLPDDLDRAVTVGLGLGHHLAPIRRVLPGADGSIWLEHPIAPGRSTWVVLDGAACPVGRLDLPDGHSLRGATRTSIWTVHQDELDVPYVTRSNLVTVRE